ncbi:Protein of unknown function [Gryllus bimaculatus]|nr:Protein of unknown function [Gryllus bimaculatus]
MSGISKLVDCSANVRTEHERVLGGEGDLVSRGFRRWGQGEVKGKGDGEGVEREREGGAPGVVKSGTGSERWGGVRGAGKGEGMGLRAGGNSFLAGLVCTQRALIRLHGFGPRTRKCKAVRRAPLCPCPAPSRAPPARAPDSPGTPLPYSRPPPRSPIYHCSRELIDYFICSRWKLKSSFFPWPRRSAGTSDKAAAAGGGRQSGREEASGRDIDRRRPCWERTRDAATRLRPCPAAWALRRIASLAADDKLRRAWTREDGTQLDPAEPGTSPLGDPSQPLKGKAEGRREPYQGVGSSFLMDNNQLFPQRTMATGVAILGCEAPGAQSARAFWSPLQVSLV